MKDCYLGIDTSAYTTSVAVASSDGKILFSNRKLLSVKQGDRGLRQSDAFFQHWQNLPGLLNEALTQYRDRIVTVCASARPRPVEGSYMPVFNAGLAAARITASALGAEIFETSHQEGHVLAAAYGNNINTSEPLIFAHLSGGTLELVMIERGQFKIIGGTKDISYGQLIDRFGVDCGLPFPSGAYVDKCALEYGFEGLKNPLSRVFRDKTYISLSGTENALKRLKIDYSTKQLSFFLMERIAESLCFILDEASARTGIKQILIGGGVACSGFIRNYCKNKNYCFGDAPLCNDNACGVALTRGINVWL